jgi:hypothetical protein
LPLIEVKGAEIEGRRVKRANRVAFSFLFLNSGLLAVLRRRNLARFALEEQLQKAAL